MSTSYPAAVGFSSLFVGCQVRVTVTNPDGTSQQTMGVVTGWSPDALALGSMTFPDPAHWTGPAGSSIAYELTAAAPTVPVEPASGRVVIDRTGTAWQRTGSTVTAAWSSTDGRTSSWFDLTRTGTVTEVTS